MNDKVIDVKYFSFIFEFLISWTCSSPVYDLDKYLYLKKFKNFQSFKC